jgi:protoporphyrinogen oxidase
MATEPGNPRVVVLGAGLAGLSAAREALRGRPCRVTVLEKADRPGGMAVSLQVGDAVSDLGPHRIYSTIDEMRQWFQEFLGDRMFVVRRVSRMYVQGRYIGYPPSAWELAAAFGPAALARFGAGWLAARVRSGLGRLGDDSFAGVMERAYGRALCDALVFPYIEKVWKTPPDRVSADAARARATIGGMGAIARHMVFRRESKGRETTLRQFHYVRGGIETLAKAMADDVRALGGEIVCNAEVTGLRRTGERAAEVVFRCGDQDRVVPADFVFATIPLRDLVGALRNGEGGAADPAGSAAAWQAAQSLVSLGAILVFALVRRPRLSADHWLYFPESKPGINRAYESKNFDASLVPSHQSLLCMEVTALPGDHTWLRSDGDLAAEAVQEIGTTGLMRGEEVLETRVHRLEHAYPLYRLDYSTHLARIWEFLRGIKNLLPLGRQGLFLHNNMDHSIYMGLRAARCWQTQSDPTAAWYGAMNEFRDLRIID